MAASPSVPPVITTDPYRALPSGTMTFTGYDLDDDIIIFTFTLNPDTLKRSRKKLGKYVRTKFGFERNNFGNDLFVFHYSGISGVFKPDVGVVTNASFPNFDVRETTAWKNFAYFEYLFEETGNREQLIRMEYWGFPGPFLGSLDSIEYSHSVNKNPYHIEYTLQFTGIPIRQAQTTIQTTVPGQTNPNTNQPSTIQIGG